MDLTKIYNDKIRQLQICYFPFQLQITKMTNYKRDSPQRSFSTRSVPAARSTMRANATTMKKNAIKPASVGRAEGSGVLSHFFSPSRGTRLWKETELIHRFLPHLTLFRYTSPFLIYDERTSYDEIRVIIDNVGRGNREARAQKIGVVVGVRVANTQSMDLLLFNYSAVI